MSGVSGITGLNGYQVDYIQNPEATPEQIQGGTVDPKHAQIGETAEPYPWESQVAMGGQHGPYGPENQLLGDPEWIWESAGNLGDDPTSDRTPITHAAPHATSVTDGTVPSGDPTETALRRIQSAEIHAVNTNASADRVTTSLGNVQNDEWEGFYEVEPGHSDLVDIPAQMKTSGFMYGTTDRTQSFARQNAFGFDSHHFGRRYAVGSIPGNTMWMKPGGRPLVKHIPSTAKLPVGSASPFVGQNIAQAYSANGAVLVNPPTEYVPPPTPNVIPQSSYYQDTSPGIEWY